MTLSCMCCHYHRVAPAFAELDQRFRPCGMWIAKRGKWIIATCGSCARDLLSAGTNRVHAVSASCMRCIADAHHFLFNLPVLFFLTTCSYPSIWLRLNMCDVRTSRIFRILNLSFSLVSIKSFNIHYLPAFSIAECQGVRVRHTGMTKCSGWCATCVHVFREKKSLQTKIHQHIFFMWHSPVFMGLTCNAFHDETFHGANQFEIRIRAGRNENP